MNLSINIYIDGKLNVWFKGKDIASALGYKDNDCAIRKRVDEEDKKTWPLFHSGQVHSCIFLNESGIYSLITGGD